jgi:hypothetical protein
MAVRIGKMATFQVFDPETLTWIVLEPTRPVAAIQIIDYGWDQKNPEDRFLLDGHGNRLPAGEDPVYLSIERGKTLRNSRGQFFTVDTEADEPTIVEKRS